MGAALRLARRGLGNVWPNPAVGCVLVAAGAGDGRVVGRGWTMPGGRPHAETEALARAGDSARGATAYVTLEQCSHRGETGPCADALFEAGIARAVVAIEDPDPRVSGSGLAHLRKGGVEVALGVGAEEAAELNAGYLLRVREGRPLVTLKTASTLDGRIATHGGESHWITGEPARAQVHGLRARHDAIMIGIGTALADDPRLTCRLPGLEGRSPIRIVVDGRLRLPLTSRLVATAAETPTWLIARQGGDRQRLRAFRDSGVDVIELPADHHDQPPLDRILAELAARGLTRVLVEGGSYLAAGLLAQSLVDRIVWHRAPSMIGGDGIPVAQPFGVNRLAEAAGFVRTGFSQAGEDLVETYERRG